MIAPDRMCAPGSEPFSSTQTEMSRPAPAASCFRRIAVDSPPGPAPTTTTSYSIDSRSTVAWLVAFMGVSWIEPPIVRALAGAGNPNARWRAWRPA